MNTYISELKKISLEKNVKIYLVGGYVRDFVLGRDNEDIDCVVEKKAVEVAKCFADRMGKRVITLGDKHKLYRIVDRVNNAIIDFSDMKGDSIEEDLRKRDFTINSLAINVVDFISKQIIDPLDGLSDIKECIIKHVNEDIFIDDPIRMLRAIRYMSQLGFKIDKKTAGLIKENKIRIKKMPGERIAQEIFKILENRNTFYYFDYMERDLGLLEEIFPEIVEMRDVGECKYHVVDSLTHSLYTLKVAEGIIYANRYFEDFVRKAYENHGEDIVASEHNRISLIKLGALFHDVGKPSAKRIDETGRVRFRGHEITGAEIIKGIAERLKLSTKERDMLYKMVAKHMYPLVLFKREDLSEKALNKMFAELKNETLDILLISLADIMATRMLLDPDEDMNKYKVHIEYIANNYLRKYKNTGVEIIIEN